MPHPCVVVLRGCHRGDRIARSNEGTKNAFGREHAEMRPESEQGGFLRDHSSHGRPHNIEAYILALGTAVSSVLHTPSSGGECSGMLRTCRIPRRRVPRDGKGRSGSCCGCTKLKAPDAIDRDQDAMLGTCDRVSSRSPRASRVRAAALCSSFASLHHLLSHNPLPCSHPHLRARRKHIWQRKKNTLALWRRTWPTAAPLISTPLSRNFCRTIKCASHALWLGLVRVAYYRERSHLR